MTAKAIYKYRAEIKKERDIDLNSYFNTGYNKLKINIEVISLSNVFDFLSSPIP